MSNSSVKLVFPSKKRATIRKKQKEAGMVTKATQFQIYTSWKQTVNPWLNTKKIEPKHSLKLITIVEVADFKKKTKIDFFRQNWGETPLKSTVI